VRALLLALLVSATAFCGVSVAAPGSGGPCRGKAPPPRYDHVVLVVLENHKFSEVAGHSPYLNALARACGLATDYASVAHPSLPNYLALTSGGTHGISSDCDDCPVSGPSIFGQTRGDWRSYLEGIPAPGYEGASSGRYVKHHNPAAYYTQLRAGYARRAIPLVRLRSDLARRRLTRFSFVAPDECHNEHDCSIATGDAWLHAWLPRIFASAGYRAGRTAVFVTYDEGGHPDNRVYTVVAARSVPPGTVVAAPFDHYSLLRTAERLLGLSCLADACAARPMDRAFRLTVSASA
jgi:hypothetical protein